MEDNITLTKSDLFMNFLWLVSKFSSSLQVLFVFSPPSFRAAQKLNLSSKRKKHQPSLLHLQEPSIYPTNFSGILQVSPPPAPPCLLRAVSKVKENPGMGKVRMHMCTRPIAEYVKVELMQTTDTDSAMCKLP